MTHTAPIVKIDEPATSGLSITGVHVVRDWGYLMTTAHNAGRRPAEVYFEWSTRTGSGAEGSQIGSMAVRFATRHALTIRQIDSNIPGEERLFGPGSHVTSDPDGTEHETFGLETYRMVIPYQSVAYLIADLVATMSDVAGIPDLWAGERMSDHQLDEIERVTRQYGVMFEGGALRQA